MGRRKKEIRIIHHPQHNNGFYYLFGWGPREISTGKKDFAEASREAEAIMHGRAVEVANAGKLTLHECLDYYEHDYVLTGNVVNTEQTVEYLNGFRLHFSAALYPKRLNDMTSRKISYLKEWEQGRLKGTIRGRVKLDEKTGKPLPPGRLKERLKISSLKTNRAILIAALNYCKDKGQIEADDVPKFEDLVPVSQEKTWLRRAQWEAFKPILIAYDSGVHWKNSRKPKPRPGKLPPVYIFACISLYCGRRGSTVENLKWDWITGLFGADPRINFLPPGTSETSKKKGGMKIPAPLLPTLRRAFTERENDFVCLSGKSLAKTFEGAARKAGLQGVTRHSLKHTCVSWMLHKGFGFAKIAVLTNTSERTLRKVYGHWDTETRDQVVDDMWADEAPAAPDLKVVGGK
jgi:integrase